MEITLAENEMPGVLEMRKRYGPTKPLKGAKIFISYYINTRHQVSIKQIITITLSKCVTSSILSRF